MTIVLSENSQSVEARLKENANSINASLLSQPIQIEIKPLNVNL